jgi:hypothetical protein
MSCAAHVVQCCLLTAVSIVPTDNKVVVLSIYRQFHIYAVCVTLLKSWCLLHKIW